VQIHPEDIPFVLTDSEGIEPACGELHVTDEDHAVAIILTNDRCRILLTFDHALELAHALIAAASRHRRRDNT
jgi:hypothetical protein